jgi:hypothetical protein
MNNDERKDDNNAGYDVRKTVDIGKEDRGMKSVVCKCGLGCNEPSNTLLEGRDRLIKTQ